MANGKAIALIWVFLWYQLIPVKERGKKMDSIFFIGKAF
jgi:hypothetical protein